MVAAPVFLSPPGALIALAAVLPLTAAMLRERRLLGLRRALGLGTPGRHAVGTAIAGACGVALLGLAAAQPALSRSRGAALRTDAEAYAVFDVTRSMLAEQQRGGPTRFDRARALALRVRDEVPQVPWGVATFSDRAVIGLFPTGDRGLVASVVQQSIGVQRPAPGYRERNATSMIALDGLANSGFYSPSSRRRVAVVFTDGETQPLSASNLAYQLRAAHVHALVVRLWSPGDRVYDKHGRDEGYRPDPTSDQTMASLRAAGIPVLSAQDIGKAPAILERWLSSGPSAAPRTESELLPLAPEAILAAIVPLGFVLVRSRR